MGFRDRRVFDIVMARKTAWWLLAIAAVLVCGDNGLWSPVMRSVVAQGIAPPDEKSSLSPSLPSQTDDVTLSSSESGVSASTSESFSMTRTLSRATPSRSTSLTESDELPVLPAEIFLVSSFVLDSSCIRTSDDSLIKRNCRTVRFGMRNDGFRYMSPAAIITFRRIVMQPQDLSDSEPFGLVAQWDDLGLATTVLTNVSQLSYTFPTNPGLVLDAPGVLEFSFSSVDTLRVETPAEPRRFSVAVSPTPVPATLDSAVTVQTIAAVLGILTLPLPFDPGLLDAQAAVIVSSSICTQPQARVVGIAGRRLLFPTIATNGELFDGLWHSLVMTAVFAGLHLLVVYAIVQRYESEFWPAAAMAYFPSLSLAAATALQPGIATSSLTLLLTSGTPPLVRMGCIFTTVCSGLAVVMPVFWLRKWVKAKAREHFDVLFEFPMVVRYLLPFVSWGPQVKARPWITPYGVMRPSQTHFTTMHLGAVTVLGLLFAVPPAKPEGCAAQFSFGILVVLAQSIVLLVKRPFRSDLYSVFSALSCALLMLPMAVSFVHCFRRNADTGDSVRGLYSVCYIVCSVRMVLSVVSHFLERLLVSPSTWPDDDAGMLEYVASEAKRRDELERRRLGDQLQDYEEVLAESDDDEAEGGAQAAGSRGRALSKKQKAAAKKKKKKQEDASAWRNAARGGVDDEANSSDDSSVDFAVVQASEYDPLKDEELQELIAKVEKHDEREHHEAVERDMLRDLPIEERASRLALGQPEPIPERVRYLPQAVMRQQRAREAERRRELLGEPLLHVQQFRGPMPPGIVHRMTSDYDQL